MRSEDRTLSAFARLCETKVRFYYTHKNPSIRCRPYRPAYARIMLRITLPISMKIKNFLMSYLTAPKNIHIILSGKGVIAKINITRGPSLL